MKGPIQACEPAPISNPTEAIYSFLGFLTTRDKEVILSSHNDCAPVAQLAAAFCEANKLPVTTDNWPNWIAPPNTEHITNVPAIGYSEKSLASEPLSVEKAGDQMLGAILGMSPANQDAVIANFLERITKQRNARVQNMQRVITDVDRDMQEAMASLSSLNSVLRGEFVVVKNQGNG